MQDRPPEELRDRPFLALFQAAFDPILMIDAEGQCVAANLAACAFLGWQSDEIVGQNLTQLFLDHPSWPEVEGPLDAFTSERRQIRCADGSFCWIMYRAIAHPPNNTYLLIFQEEPLETSLPPVAMAASVAPLNQPQEGWYQALNLNLAQAQILLNNIPDLLLHLRRDGTCLNCLLPAERADLFVPIQNHIAEVLPPDVLEEQLAIIAQVLDTGQVVVHEHELVKYGRLWVEEVRVVPMNADEALLIVRDITDRKRTETALQETEARLQDVLNNSAAYITRIWVFEDGTWEYDYVSAACERLYGYTAEEIRTNTNLWQSRILLEDVEQVIRPNLENILNNVSEFSMEYRFCHRDGSIRWIAENSTCRYDDRRQARLVTVVAIDITERKRAEAIVQQQREREQVLSAVTQNIRSSLNLPEVLNSAVQEARQLLQADRTLIYRFNADWSGEMVVESVLPPWPPVLGTHIHDPCFGTDLVDPYRQGRVHQIEDLHHATLASCHRELLEPLQIRAQLVAPLVCNQQLWGLFCVHQCSGPRRWQPSEIELLQQFCERLAIAIQQSELYQRVQHLNANLEQQVRDRTLALEQSLRFEALLRRITTQMRDGLDEQHIVQTAVDGLGHELDVLCCDVGMYDPEATTVTIQWEYNSGLEPLENNQFRIAESGDPEAYSRHLLRGEWTQFCPLNHSPARPSLARCTTLICPIVDDQEVLGDLWLVKAQEQWFDEAEVLLVQQVANQCAIALRQARLYHMAQAQVVELERLNRLKDDFLSTVSHELRTPMANIKMATEMVELRLTQRGILGQGDDQALERYFYILKDACQREIRLIDDLLDLTRLNSDIDPIIPFQIHLRSWVVHVAESFRDRIRRQQQTLQISIADDLTMETDLAYMERIVTELLNNACKYTPPGEGIYVSGQRIDRQILLIFANSGVELPTEECDRIFEQFYRIPTSDPWRHEGTGLGLALVRKLTEKLGGTIRAESQNQQLRMILVFPET